MSPFAKRKPAPPETGLSERYRLLFERHPNPLWVADAQTSRILAVNEAAALLHGYTRDEMIGMSVPSLLSPQEVLRFATNARIRTLGQPHHGTWKHRKKDGTLIDVEVRAVSIDWDGRPARLVAGTDLTDRIRAEERMRVSERLLAQAEKVAQIGSFEVNVQTGEVIWSEEVYRITGVSPQTFTPGPKSFYQFDHPDDAAMMKRLTGQAIAAGATLQADHRIVRPDGEVRWVYEHCEYTTDRAGNVTRIVGIIQDITERKEAEEQRLRDAHYDRLTGLPNQVLFEARLNELLGQARADDENVVLVHLDIDRFSHSNEVFGHEAGNELLVLVAERLSSACGDARLLARLAGDEFALLFKGLLTHEDVEAFGSRAMSVFERPFEIGRSLIHATASAGISIYPLDGKDALELLRHAHIAKNRAKADGGGEHRRFAAAMRAEIAGRTALESELRTAVERDQFVVYYQPLVDAQGVVRGAEALARWKHPKRGVIAPAVFIPVAEETGLIVAIGNLILDKACAQAQKWRLRDPAFRIAVNVSARQVRDRGFETSILAALEQSGLPPEALELEITESMLMEQGEISASVLSALKRHGVRISLDDFGTGYTSFNYVARYGIDTLKIDRSFVQGVIDNAQKHAVTRAIMALAGELNLDTVAEGVESKAQFYVLRQWGVKLLQGYYFSPPVAGDAFEDHCSKAKHIQSGA
jgi:diguanylate cyclase (GGDEF)-like protein/PAS domain S-box-containing protein